MDLRFEKMIEKWKKQSKEILLAAMRFHTKAEKRKFKISRSEGRRLNVKRGL